MSKKILIISASPRKGGNSDCLCNQFIAGAIEVGNQVEKIFLRDKKVGYCVACEACQKNEGKCAIKDDMTEILEKMVQADAIVMATPVYYYSMNGQLKTLIDRTVARVKELSYKDFYFILTAADDRIEEMKSTVEGFRGFTRCLDNVTEKGIIYGVGAWAKGDIHGNPSIEDAFNLGKTIH